MFQLAANGISFGSFEWSEIIYAVVGSFIGIFIPLWIDKHRAKKKVKEDRQKLVDSLEKELASIKELIEVYSEPEYESRFRIFTFTTFVWDSVVSAGLLPEMLSDTDVKCEKLIEIYSGLSMLRDAHNDFCGLLSDFCELGVESVTDDMRQELLQHFENIKSLRRSISAAITEYEESVGK